MISLAPRARERAHPEPCSPGTGPCGAIRGAGLWLLTAVLAGCGGPGPAAIAPRATARLVDLNQQLALPVISARLGQQRLRLVVDTGASLHLIGRSAGRRLGLRAPASSSSTPKATVNDAFGHVAQPLSFFGRLPVAIDGLGAVGGDWWRAPIPSQWTLDKRGVWQEYDLFLAAGVDGLLAPRQLALASSSVRIDLRQKQLSLIDAEPSQILPRGQTLARVG